MPTARPASTPRRRRQRWRRGVGCRGSLSLEAAMALPLVALCAVGLLQLVGVARDALLAQDLARLGARTAATDPSHGAVVAAVESVAGPDVTVDVTITPPLRRPGDPVTVQIRLTRPGRLLEVDLTGRAVTRGEPVLEQGAPP